MSYGLSPSIYNDSNDILSAGATFTGQWVRIAPYNTVTVAVKTDQAGTLYMEFSPDGVNNDSSLSFSVAAGVNEVHRLTVTRLYYRTRFTNTSGSAQTYFRLQTLFGSNQPPLTAPLNETISSDSDSLITRSVIYGQNDAGNFTAVPVDSYGNLKVSNLDKIAFVTTTTLNAGQTFNTSILELLPMYTQVQTNILASHDGTINVYWYSDSGGTDTVRTLSLPYVAANGYQCFSAPAGFGSYVKYSFTNGASNQTDFYYSTTFLTHAQSPQLMNVEAPISPKMVASLNRVVLVGKTEGGDHYQNISSTDDGHLEVSIQGPVGAFGELATMTPYPVAQIDFVYGINTYTTTQETTGSGQITNGNNLLSVQSGAATSSSAQLSSLRYIKYRPGQGARGLFTAVFGTPASGNNQYAGLFTASLNNGFGFGYNGTTFGIWYMNDGTPTHIPQTSWNEDVCSGVGGSTNKSGINLNPQYGNVYKIQYQYLGFGNITFSIENAINGQFVIVHQIRIANASATTSVSQPSLTLLWRSDNTTNNTNVILKAASGALFLEGDRRFLGPAHGLDNNKSLTATTHTNMITLKNATSYNGANNRSHIRIRHITFAVNTGGVTSGIATFKIIRNATLGGTPIYTTINGTTVDSGVTITSGNSIVSYDTAGTTVTGGTVLYNAIIGIGNNDSDDLTELDLFAYPGDTITFSLTATQNVTGGIGITWSEDI